MNTFPNPTPSQVLPPAGSEEQYNFDAVDTIRASDVSCVFSARFSGFRIPPKLPHTPPPGNEEPTIVK